MIYTYDGTGEKCPVPLIQLRLLLKKMNAGDQCILILTDIGSQQDIPKLLKQKGYAYIMETLNENTVEMTVQAP